MYKSPIEMLITDIQHQIVEQQDEQIYKAVVHYVPNVDRVELLKALEYDRGQYEKGYADGKADAVVHGRWIVKSKEIKPFEYVAVAECSKCHAETESNRSMYISGFSMGMVDEIVRREAKDMGLGNYCPNCGAKMDADK